jgi:hypothetical protein
MNDPVIKKSIFLLLLTLLIASFLQSSFELVKLKPLKGAIVKPEKKTFYIEEWFSGGYQEYEEKYLNETFGLRNFFIRINNQLEFILFNNAKANGVIIGKENYLYEENYIKAYNGTDFIGYDSIYQRMQRIKYIQDTLAKLNKNIIIIFAAGKGSFYPEYFPEQYNIPKTPTNYQTYVALTKQMGISTIDFNKYFIENKKTSPYPLYPQYGIHWSYYASCLVTDSIIRFIEHTRNIDMPNLFWTEMEHGQPRDSDKDIEDGMNMLFNLRSFEMYYPHVQFQSDSGKTKPNVLIVSDSFYWPMFNLGISNAFTGSNFWFYNNQVYPEAVNGPISTSQLNIKDEIAKRDLIILMATDATLPNFGWGFIENLYNDFKGIKNKSITSN